DRPAVPTRGGPGPAHRRPDEGLDRTGDLDLLTVLRLHVGRGRPLVVGGHPRHVLAGERGGPEGALRGAVVAGGRRPLAAAVPGRGEAALAALGDGEADGAPRGVVDVVGVTTRDVLQQPRPYRRHADADVLTRQARGLDEGGARLLTGRLHHDPVVRHVDVPDGRVERRDARGRRIQLRLGRPQIGQRP